MENKFSSEFYSFIGDGNIVYGEMFSKSQYSDIVKSNIETMLSKSCSILSINHVENLHLVRSIPGFELRFKAKYESWEMYIRFPVDGDPRSYMFDWKVIESGDRLLLNGTTMESGNGFISMCAMMTGRSELDVQNFIAECNCLSKNSIFKFDGEEKGLWVGCNDKIEYDFLPSNIQVGTDNFQIKNTYLIRDSSVVKSAFVLYRSCSGSEFLLPCSLSLLTHDCPAPCIVADNKIQKTYSSGRKMLEPGERPYLALGQRGISYLLNMDKLKQFPIIGKVLLFESPLLAIKIQSLLETFDENFFSKYLITSWYGGYCNITHADFDYLQGKSVVFVPELRAESYENVKICHSKCVGSMVSEFTILSCPIVLKKMPKSVDLYNMNSFERMLAEGAVEISDLDQNMFVDLVAKAMSFDKYTKALNCAKTWKSKVTKSGCSAECLTSIDNIACAGNESTDLSYDRIVQTKKITIIIGPNDSGKSIFLLSILRAIADGVSVFGVEARKRQNVLLIDGETDKDMLSERNDRIKSALKSSRERYILGNLYSIGMGFGDSFNFDEECSRMQIEKYIHDNKIEVVAFDNLNSLVPGHVQSTQKISNFFVWLRKLEETYGVAIVLAHHTKDEKGENKRSSGSKEIDEKCQTVIAITGRNELEALKDDVVVPELDKYKTSKGALFQVHVKKCKNVHKLEGEVFYCHLPLDVESPTIGPGWICFHDNSRMASTHLKFEHNEKSAEIIPQCYSGLTDNERRVMIELAHKYDSFPRSKVDILLGISSTMSNNIINSLIGKHKLLAVLKGGRGRKNTEYGLCRNNNK